MTDRVIANYEREEVFRGTNIGERVIWIFLGKSHRTSILIHSLLAGILIGGVVLSTLIWKIFRKLKENSNRMSKRSRILHVQFTVLLVVQLSSPIVFIFGPFLIVAAAMLYGFYVSKEEVNYGLLVIGFYAPANSIFTIVCVTPYRKHAWMRIRYAVGALLYVVTCGHRKPLQTTPTFTSPSISTQPQIQLNV
jgi:hypothetical protein